MGSGIWPREWGPQETGQGQGSPNTWGTVQAWGGLARHPADEEESLLQIQEKPPCSRLRRREPGSHPVSGLEEDTR